MTKQEANTFLSLAVRASLPAARAILRIYEEGNWELEEKADKTPLTRADREAHDAILSVLEEGTPEVPVLSEEGAHLPFETRRTWERLWVVDPLDGTKEFLSRNGEFTVNVALVDSGVPVLGVVGVPALDTYYLAAGGHGAFRASRAALEAAAGAAPGVADPATDAAAGTADTAGAAPADQGGPTGAAGAGDLLAALRASEEAVELDGEPSAGAADPSSARVVASRSHMNAETEAFIEGLKTRYDAVELVQAGSAVKLCRVAEGGADYYPRLAPTMEWDTAAGDAVVREVGGRVVIAAADGSSEGQALTYNKEDLHNPFFVAVGKGRDI
ncbi:MAG: 3'(2'),5'-bisphosphate nucleotidase CysQ family protein [Spirochaetota bacterium]